MADQRRSRRRALVAGAVLVIVAAALVGAYRLALEVVRGKVAGALGPGAEVAAVEVGLRSVVIEGVRLPPDEEGWPAQDLLRAESITIVPALRTLLSETVRLRSVTLRKPYLSVLRTGDDGLVVVPTLLRGDEEAAEKPTAAPGVFIEKLTIEEGAAEVFDATVSREPWRVGFAGVEATVRDVAAPGLAGEMPFELRATLEGPRHDGDVSLSGRLDGASRDLDLDASLRSVDLLALQPYLVRTTRARLSSGSLDLALDAQVRERRLHAPGRLVLTDLAFAPGVGATERVMGVPRDVLLKAMAAGDGRIELAFTLEGDVDDPRFSLNEAIGVQIASALSDSLGVSVRGLVEGVGELGGEAVKGAEKASKEIGSALEGLLKRR